MRNSRPSPKQQELANLLGISISEDTPDIAAARLIDQIAEAIGYEPREDSTSKQREFAASLGQDVGADSKRVASAKIGEALFCKNQDAIAALSLHPGDRVIRVSQFEHNGELQFFEREFIVSSIQASGRVFFKGGNGQGAWPTQLKKPKD